MNIVLSTSLSPESNSRILAREATRILEQDGKPVTLLDLRDYPLPLCDAGPAYDHANVAALSDLLHDATAIIVASPIYNFDGSAALKNVIELTGNRAWENKVVGFVCAAAGRASYMSIMSLANSLMLDFRSLIVPRFVYATADAFAGEAIVDPEITRRVADLARTTAKLGTLLKAA